MIILSRTFLQWASRSGVRFNRFCELVSFLGCVAPQPIREGQCGEYNGDIISHTVNEGGLTIQRIPFFEKTARRDVAISQGEDRYPVPLAVGLEFGFVYLPGVCVRWGWFHGVHRRG